MKVINEKDIRLKVIPVDCSTHNERPYIVDFKLELSPLTLEMYINQGEEEILSKKEVKETIKLCKQIVARTFNKYQGILEDEITHSEKIRLRKYINKKVEEYCKELNLETPVIITEDIPSGNLGFAVLEKNKIHLNSYLGRIPYKYTDLVLYHELLHLKYPKKESENPHTQNLVQLMQDKFKNYMEIAMEAAVIEAFLASLFFVRLFQKYTTLTK